MNSQIAWETADFEWTLRRTYCVTVRLRSAPTPREAMYFPDYVQRHLEIRGLKDAAARIAGDMLTVETGNDIFGLDARGWHSAIEQALSDTVAMVRRREMRENAQGATWLVAMREPDSDA